MNRKVGDGAVSASAFKIWRVWRVGGSVSGRNEKKNRLGKIFFLAVEKTPPNSPDPPDDIQRDVKY